MRNEPWQRKTIDAGTNVTDLQVLVDQEITDRVDGLLGHNLGHLGDRVALVLVIARLAEVRQPDVAPGLGTRHDLCAQTCSRFRRADDLAYLIGSAVLGPIRQDDD